MNTTLESPPAIGTGIAEYDGIAAGLAELADRYKDRVFDVATTAGDKAARAARQELVRVRVALEAKRVELKAPALERSRLIDAKAKEITAEILALEAPIDAQIKAQEAAKEAERQAKIKAEADRVAAHRGAIDSIRSCAVSAVGVPAAKLKIRIAHLEGATLAGFEEFQEQAEIAKAQTLTSLRESLERAEAQEAEAARLIAERAELDRLKAEQKAQHDAEVLARHLASTAEANRLAAERKAEDERHAAFRKVERERLAAEQAEIAKAQQIEADRLAAERRAFEAEQREARANQAAIDLAAKQAREAEERRIAVERAELDRRQQAEIARQEAEATTRELAALEARERLDAVAPRLLAACVRLIDRFDAIDCDEHGEIGDIAIEVAEIKAIVAEATAELVHA